MNSKKESPETYTLQLSSGTGNPAASLARNLPYANINNVTWRVDYDNLFKGRQSLFEFCRVRFQLINGGGTYTTDGQQGYISASLPTSFNAQTTNGCILGLVTPKLNPISLTDGVFIVNGQNDIGVDINHEQLTGVQPLNIQWIKTDGSLITGLANAYIMELMFEFYNI